MTSDETLKQIASLPADRQVLIYEDDLAENWPAKFTTTDIQQMADELLAWRRLGEAANRIDFFFPNPDVPGRGTSASINNTHRGINYHVIGDLPGEADSVLDAFQKVVTAVMEEKQ